MRRINRTEFDNGLILLTEKRPSSKKVTLLVGVKVGSVNETEKLNGGSHFNEHMLFKSNSYRTNKQIIEELEQSGTDINAFTSETSTAFYCRSMPAEILKAIPIVYEAATNLDYNAEEFERERDVILSEISLYNEQPWTYSWDVFKSFLFRGTPLGRTIAGTIDSMGSVTKAELENLKNKHYLPNNMAIVAVGNFDEAALTLKVAETFGKLPVGNVPSAGKININNRHEEAFREKGGLDLTYLDMVIKMKQKLLVDMGGLDLTYLNMGYIVPGMTHEDAYILKVLDGVLSAGMSSRLFTKLREEKGIGYAVGSNYNSFGDVASFSYYVSGFDPKKYDEAVGIILSETSDLRARLVSDVELERTKNLLVSHHLDKLEDIDSSAFRILEKEFDKIPYDFRKDQNYIRKVTGEQIMAAAGKYLTEEYTLTALMPKGK